MPKENVCYIHAFSLTQCVGPKTFEKLFIHFNHDLRRAWKASRSDFIHAGITEETSAHIIEKRAHIDPETEYAKLIKQNVDVLVSEEFPPLLKEIAYPPAILYLRGSYPYDALPIAVVGTRRPTSYGQEAAKTITRELGFHGCAIISGLAMGIDGVAHKAALESKARTVAVLGSGIDDASIYPTFHRPLAQKILAAGGALVSEFPPGTSAQKHHFPQRNRIIAGLARGTVVIEAKKESGALITARLALEYNRDVFAVPGSIFSSLSDGPNTLIKEGAMPIRSARDILDEYGIGTAPSSAATDALTDTEQKIMALLETEKTFEELRHMLSIDTWILNPALAVLELNEYIKNLGNQTYIRKK